MLVWESEARMPPPERYNTGYNLGVGGAVALVIGSIMLMDTDLPAFQIAVPVIAAVGVGSLALTGLTVRLAFKAHGHPVVTGGDTVLSTPSTAPAAWARPSIGKYWRAELGSGHGFCPAV